MINKYKIYYELILCIFFIIKKNLIYKKILIIKNKNSSNKYKFYYLKFLFWMITVLSDS